MSRKPPLPGLDEEALATLASQFPSLHLPPPEEKPAPRTEPPPAAAPKAKPPGRGLAVMAIVLAFLAILAAAVSLAPPGRRAQLLAVVRGTDSAADRRPARPSLATPQAASQAAVAAPTSASGEATAKLAASIAETRKELLAEQASRRGDDTRLAAIEGRLKALDGDLQGLQTRLAAAEQQIGTTLLARLSAVETKVGGLRQANRRREKFFLAATQLRDALRSSRPFATQLAAVVALAGKDPAERAALDELQKHSRDGVATVAELRDDFTGTMAPRLIALSEANRPSVAARAAVWLQSWYASGPSGGSRGDRNAAVVASAERSLDRGQLAAAVDQVLLLEDQAALVTAGWLANASARLAVDKAASALMRQALDHIARAD